jgi:site-specific DNA-cytosine methylase
MYVRATIVVFENVKNIRNFPDIISDIKSTLSHYHVNDFVLDAGNYGAAQHRERWFCVAVQSSCGSGTIQPPPHVPIRKTVSDVLDRRVQHRQMSNTLVPFMTPKYMDQHPHTSTYGLVKLFDGVAEGYFKSGFSVHRIYSVYGKSPTLTTTNDTHYYEIGGKLTSRERWRLMGCSDDDYDIVIGTLHDLSKVTSSEVRKTDLVNVFVDKISGNAIVVECIYELLKEIVRSL